MDAQGLVCNSCAIRHRAVCGAMSDTELLELNRISNRRTFEAGQIIMADNEPSEFFANVISGVVKLTKTLCDGREQIVGLLFASDFVGRAYRPENQFSAEAATNTELCCIPRSRFERLLGKHPDLERRLFQHTLNELDCCRDWALLLGRKSAEEKVASFLTMIARRVPNIGCAHSDELKVTRFELPLTRADMADYLGLTIETVSRQITRLKTKGLIALDANREIVVPDIDKLSELAHIGPEAGA